MRVMQRLWTRDGGWSATDTVEWQTGSVVLVFGDVALLEDRRLLEDVRRFHPGGTLIGCSTAGEIIGPRVLDESLAVTALGFEHAQTRIATTRIGRREESFRAGKEIAEALGAPDLKHVVVFSDGLHVNGSELVKGLASALPPGIKVTGGLAGDGDRFQRTLVVADDLVEDRLVTALGLYGPRLRVGYGSIGGWDPFGPERLVTRSRANVLYELDGNSALDLYKTYLGRHAQDLPASGLLFPLSLRFPDRDDVLVRTILAVDETENSLVFAGDVPEGAFARLMKANFDRLVDGAVKSAESGLTTMGGVAPEFALLISCVGRKMILGQRIEEEVEGVMDVLGQKTVLAGFYSYGEISPSAVQSTCELHNQTMTVTAFSEKQ